MAFEKQIGALRAYLVAYQTNGGRPVRNEDAGSIIDMAAMTIVVTNAFFVESGLLIRQKEDQGFIPTPEALAYHKAWEWNPETARHKLGELFERTWFSEALIPRLKMRPHEERDAKTVLAEACGASKEYEARV